MSPQASPASRRKSNSHKPLDQEHAILDYISGLEQERQIDKERADFDVIAQNAARAISDAPNIPPDYAKLRMTQWAAIEYNTDADFAEAWDI